MKYLLLPVLVTALALMAFIQPGKRVVTGMVTDAGGHAITAASVVVKGTAYAVSTDNKGAFSITVENDAAVLVFSYVGFIQQEVAVGKRTTVKVVLQKESTTLDEVVVVGYGTKRKMDMTGSVAVMNYAPVAAAPAALYGAAPGVSVRGIGNAKMRRGRPVSDSNFNTESYDQLSENPFLKATENPLSTFSIDVDAASYSNVRRYISGGSLPPAGAVRVEEMINYFSYEYPQPTGEHPFSVNTEMAACPWNAQHKIALIGLQGKKIAYEKLPASNLVFLIDVSGSMSDPNKLPLVKSSLQLLTDQLRPQDKVAIVVYAGNAGLVLPATSGEEKMTIKAALERLEAGGSTAGGQGIQLAYKIAGENLMKGGNNRVILCTDGDFNVGASSDAAMVALIEKERETGISLTVLGYGMGNYKDSKMQQLADKGNGNHAYIDGITEAKKVLINEFGGTLFTIAKDVKLQVEFNPAKVQGYRLIGYENRILAKEDFNNDKKDAGDMGSGHTVTALYEIIPAETAAPELDSVDQLRYQKVKTKTAVTTFSNELMNIKLRYKQPDGNTSRLLEKPVNDAQHSFTQASENFRFATAVAAFGMQLNHSKYNGKTSFQDILAMAQNAQGTDKEHYRVEFLQLVREAAKLSDAQALTGGWGDRRE